MTCKIQDLSKVLLSVEKTVRQLKEGRKHTKSGRKDSNLGQCLPHPNLEL